MRGQLRFGLRMCDGMLTLSFLYLLAVKVLAEVNYHGSDLRHAS
jgi:hypothetical protein